MKKKLLALAVLMICASLISLGTLAYFNAEDTAHNVITTSGVEIDLQEWKELPSAETPEGVPFADLTGVMPGEKVSKIVTVKNNGGAAYVRVWVSTAISEPGDPLTNPTIKNLPLTMEVNGETVEVIEINYNTEKWTQGEDGYWYYNRALKTGETTEPLFTTVEFHKLMGNAYQNSVTRVDVSAQAVQSANNGESALDAAGWPET